MLRLTHPAQSRRHAKRPPALLAHTTRIFRLKQQPNVFVSHFTTALCLEHTHLRQGFRHDIPRHLRIRQAIITTAVNIPPAAATITQVTLSQFGEARLPFSCFLCGHQQVRPGSQNRDAAVTSHLLRLLPGSLAAALSASDPPPRHLCRSACSVPSSRTGTPLHARRLCATYQPPRPPVRLTGPSCTVKLTVCPRPQELLVCSRGERLRAEAPPRKMLGVHLGACAPQPIPQPSGTSLLAGSPN